MLNKLSAEFFGTFWLVFGVRQRDLGRSLP